MPNSFSFTLKKSKVFVKPCFGESFSEFGAVIWLHTFNRHWGSLNEMHQKYHGRIGAVFFKGFHIHSPSHSLQLSVKFYSVGKFFQKQ